MSRGKEKRGFPKECVILISLFSDFQYLFHAKIQMSKLKFQIKSEWLNAKLPVPVAFGIFPAK